MKISENLRRELINSILIKFGTNISEMEKVGHIIPTGVVKNKKPVTDYWWNVYSWQNKEEFQEWRDWAETKVKDKYELNRFELEWDIFHKYIYKKEGDLF